MVKYMKNLMRSRHQLAMLALLLTGLSACAEDPHAHYYHPRAHMGQNVPNWYKPPETPQNTFHYQTSPKSNGGQVRYDR